MYFAPQPDFVNTRVFLPPELQYQPNKKTNITLSMLNAEKQAKKNKVKSKVEGCGPLGTDVQVSLSYCTAARFIEHVLVHSLRLPAG
jgi:hypothetical protein